MDKPKPTPGRVVQAAVRKALRELGPAKANYAATLQAMHGQGIKCSEQCWERNWRAVFVDKEPDARQPLVADPSPTDDDQPPAREADGPIVRLKRPPAREAQPADPLAGFVRFAVAVRDAGGVTVARAYLDALESVQCSV